MFAARAGRWHALSIATDGARSQTRVGRRRRTEYRWNGSVQPRKQLECCVRRSISQENHATPAPRPAGKEDYIPRFTLSRSDDRRRWRAGARIQLPLRRPGNAGNFAPNEIRFVAVTGVDDRRQDRELLNRVGPAAIGHGCARLGWLPRQ